MISKSFKMIQTRTFILKWIKLRIASTKKNHKHLFLMIWTKEPQMRTTNFWKWYNKVKLKNLGYRPSIATPLIQVKMNPSKEYLRLKANELRGKYKFSRESNNYKKRRLILLTLLKDSCPSTSLISTKEMPIISNKTKNTSSFFLEIFCKNKLFVIWILRAPDFSLTMRSTLNNAN